MKCEVCQETELEGTLLVKTRQAGGATLIAILESSPRNWICCDSCNKVICHICCQYPKSGYCDRCIDRYNLYAYLVEVGRIRE